MKAILLDALGTLVRLEPPAPRLRSELAGRFGISVSEAQAEAAIAAEIAYYRTHLDEGVSESALGALRRQCASVLRDALPPSERLAAVDGDALTELLLAALHFHVFPEVPEALETARRRGRRLVVVSNWDVSLHGVLERLAVAPRVDRILTSAEVGVRKPAAEIFERALAIAGVRADEAIHVGDSLEEDVRGARNAGIVPVLVRRDGGVGPDGVRTIASLGELAG
jgi:putative hydrolase of the HAD superfamily